MENQTQNRFSIRLSGNKKAAEPMFMRHVFGGPCRLADYGSVAKIPDMNNCH
jgi:hypothetical protein